MTAFEGGSTTYSDGPEQEPVLVVEDLSVDIGLPKSTVHAVDGVSLTIGPGEKVGLVGESGCGKSTLGLAIAGLLPENAHVKGRISLAGRELVGLDESALRHVRGAEVGIVFQDPMTSLNPTKRVGVQVGEALRLQRGASKSEARRAALDMLDLVGLAPARRPARTVPARAFRRNAPAGRYRCCADLPAKIASGGRTHDSPRRHHPGPNPGTVRQAAEHAVHGLAAHNPRHGRRRRPH